MFVDPLAEKYPNIGGYVYVANNPILFIDPDGRDFIVSINHKTRSIEILATYYTTKGESEKIANEGVQLWNNLSDIKYTFNDGSNTYDYSVNFKLNVQAFDTENEAIEAFENDKTIAANYFEIRDNYYTHGEAKSYNLLEGINHIIVDNSLEGKDLNTSSHEIGHSLGLGHFTKGLMKNGGDKKNPNVTTNNISKILSNINIGIYVGGNDNLPTSNTAKSTVNEEGTKPQNFENGTIIYQ